LRRSFGLVAQDVFLFSGSIADNITSAKTILATLS
jgi:ABC-type multidrug transport system fused ATPase/permease subunit